MARENTDLPFGDAFSINQLDLDDDEPSQLVYVLELAKKHEGDPDAFDDAIADRFDMQPYRAKNVRLGISDAGYQIMNDSTEFEFTEFGEELHDLIDDEDELYDQFAVHILQNLHGQKVINVIMDLRSEGKSRKFDNIRKELEDRYELHIDQTSNHWSQMRGWLYKADVIQNLRSPSYDINWTKIEDLTGANSDLILELSDLTGEQQAYLRALAIIDPDGEIEGTKVREVAESEFEIEIDQNSIVGNVLDPLEEAGYLTHDKPTRGKPRVVEPTDKFESEVVSPLLDDLADYVGAPRSALRKSFAELLEELDEGTKYERGVALEVLAIKIGRLLNLDYTAWRARGRNTSGNEVDVVMDSVDLTFQRWQIQCKNTKSKLSIDEVTREVGISRRLKTDVILIIGREGVTSDARRFADLTMSDENLTIVFLDDQDIMRLDQSPEHLINKLQGEARRAKSFKRLGDGQMVEVSERMVSDEDEEEVEETDVDDLLDNEQPSLDEYTNDGEGEDEDEN
ncbi:hypothetical protein G3I44_13565 [Halogeometricum borinquense]|uniref:Restriction endonuclease type IV Mrr domain-containing protein n=1 Tax=Halogeometricum borinquense TaxID=60847 RepID=A0A6C0ULI6_9EURY|nr:restriction endonuclease [Halogeometricum borinquense]QIB75221.1 hypothetical protein G3I44_13565 [Halogeometricum borinquense]